MAIKIPRGSQPEVRLPNTNTLAVAANNPVSRSFDKLTSFLDVVATRKAENDKRIEAQRILNKNTTNKSLLEKSKNEFLQHIEDSQEVLTQENYNILLKDWEKKQENWIKQSYKDDDKALEMFLSDKIDVFNSTFVGLNEKRNQKVLAQGKIVFDTEIQNVNEKIDGLPVSAFVWDKFDIILKEEKNRWENGLVTGYTTSSWKEREKELTNLVMKRVVSANKLWTNPITERVEPDYIAIYSELNEAKSSKSWYGKTFTLNQIDALKTYFKKQSDSQKQIMDMYANREHTKLYKGFVDDLIEIRRGTVNSADLAATFEKRVQNAKYLKDETKLLLQKKLLDWQSKGVEPWKTIQGQKANTLLNILIGNRAIDTEKERALLDEVYWDGLIKNEDYRTLNARIDDNIKDRNKYKMPLYKNVISMLGTEMGMKDISKLMEVDSTNPADLQAFLQNKYPKAVFDTLNYFSRLLAVGENKGFTYDEMLSDTTSKNYIVDKALTFAKAAKDGKIDMTEQVDVSFLKDLDGSLNDAIHWDKPYTIGYDLWFDGLTPLGDDREIPKRLEGETINTYLARTMNELKKRNIKLPSVITGYNFDEDLDLNTELIVPNMD